MTTNNLSTEKVVKKTLATVGSIGVICGAIAFTIAHKAVTGRDPPHPLIHRTVETTIEDMWKWSDK